MLVVGGGVGNPNVVVLYLYERVLPRHVRARLLILQLGTATSRVTIKPDR